MKIKLIRLLPFCLQSALIHSYFHEFFARNILIPASRNRSRSLLINLRDKLNAIIFLSLGCQFYPVGEYLKFVRVPENIETGTEILSLEAHPRNRLAITPVDKVRHIFCILIHLSETTRKKRDKSLGGGCWLLRLQGDERDARFPDSGAVPGGSGGRGVAEEPIKISSILRLGFW